MEMYFVEQIPRRGKRRNWAVLAGQRDSHVTYRRGRRGPFRGQAQALIEEWYRERRERGKEKVR